MPGTLHDPNLVNGWGLTAGATTPWWVANNGTNTSTLYNGDGTARSLIVSVHKAPTGAVFNGTADFVVSSGGASFTKIPPTRLAASGCATISMCQW